MNINMFMQIIIIPLQDRLLLVCEIKGDDSSWVTDMEDIMVSASSFLLLVT